MSRFTRRTFLERGLQASAAAGLADLAFLHRLPAVSAADVRDGAKRVELEADIEPLVRLLEDTRGTRFWRLSGKRYAGEPATRIC